MDLELFRVRKINYAPNQKNMEKGAEIQGESTRPSQGKCREWTTNIKLHMGEY